MERAEIFIGVRIGIDAVIEANRADRQFVAQARAYGIAHIVKANILRAWQKVPGISEYGALQFSENRESVFDIKDGKEFSTHRMTVIIVGTKITFGETAHCCRAAIEKTFVNGNGSRLLGAAGCERMNNAGTRTKCDRGLAKPALQRCAGRLIFNYTRRERFGSKWKIVTDAHRASDIFDIASERAGG